MPNNILLKQYLSEVLNRLRSSIVQSVQYSIYEYIVIAVAVRDVDLFALEVTKRTLILLQYDFVAHLICIP